MLLITADIHLNINPRDAYRHDWQKEFRRLARKYKVDAALILGDLTDQKEEHKSALVNALVEHIYQLSRICTVIVLRGNHDLASLSETPFFEFIQRLENVFWVGEPTLAWDPEDLTPALRSELAGAAWLPHTPNYQRDWQGLDLRRPELIFTHNTFAGAEVGARKLEGIPTDIFADGSCVTSGDVHTPQSFDVVTYVGAPYTIDFGDNYKPRVLLADPSNRLGELKSIPCTGPQKRLLEISSDSETASQLAKKKGFNPNDIVKVRVNLGRGAFARWSEITDKIHQWGHRHGYVIDMIQPVVDKPTNRERAARALASPQSDKELLKVYAKRQNIDAQTTQIGLELLDGDNS